MQNPSQTKTDKGTHLPHVKRAAPQAPKPHAPRSTKNLRGTTVVRAQGKREARKERGKPARNRDARAPANTQEAEATKKVRASANKQANKLTCKQSRRTNLHHAASARRTPERVHCAAQSEAKRSPPTGDSWERRRKFEKEHKACTMHRNQIF